jgi:hypothetical protein
VVVEQSLVLDGWDFVTFESDFISLHDGVLIIRIGYAWDGASGPVVQTDALIDASVFHDALYQILRGNIMLENVKSKYQLLADELLRQLYLQNCMKNYVSGSWKIKLAKIRAEYIFWAVQKFGKNRTMSNG